MQDGDGPTVIRHRSVHQLDVRPSSPPSFQGYNQCNVFDRGKPFSAFSGSNGVSCNFWVSYFYFQHTPFWPAFARKFTCFVEKNAQVLMICNQLLSYDVTASDRPKDNSLVICLLTNAYRRQAVNANFLKTVAGHREAAIDLTLFIELWSSGRVSRDLAIVN